MGGRNSGVVRKPLERPYNPAMGHRFGPELICCAKGCRQTWEKQQVKARKCRGTLAVSEPKQSRVGTTPRRLGYLLQLNGIWQWTVGEKAGVGVTAVSIVLRGDSGSSQITADKVEAAALELLAEKGVDTEGWNDDDTDSGGSSECGAETGAGVPSPPGGTHEPQLD